MIELMVTLVIVALLLLLAAPGFSSWIQSSQIRTAAEAIQSGLVLARVEAIRQNTAVSFQLVTTVTNACAKSTSGTNWVVSRDDPTSKCGAAPSDSVSPRIVQKRTANDGSPNAVFAADQSTITFNGFGQATNLGAPTARIDVTNPSGGACATADGPMRCLRVEVTTAGQTRLCDPAASSGDPRAC